MDQVIEKLQNADTIMEVTDLCKFFKAGRKQTLKAVDHVSVSIKRGETLGRRIRLRKNHLRQNYDEAV